MKRLSRLGREIASIQEDALDVDDALDVAERELDSMGAFEGEPRGRRAPYLLAAAALLVGLVAFGWWWPRPAPALTYQVGGSGDLALDDRWLSTPADGTLPVRFSDGSSVLLRGGTRARVTALTSAGADVVVESGSVAVDIAPHAGADWSVHVGPFRVRVRGTRFNVAWDPATGTGRVSMQHGRVDVTGPGIQGVRALIAGEELQLAIHSQPTRAPAADASTTLPQPPAPSASAPLLPEPSSSAPSATPTGRRKPSWKVHFAARRYREAFELARPHRTSILSSGGANDLMLLGDAARYSGSSGDATQSYTTLRRRFPGSEQAATAGFKLGLMAGGSAGAGWFRRYLSEAPNGPFAREALGRVLEAEQGTSSAAGTAKRYLSRFPSGPHAALAHKTLRIAGKRP